MAVVEPHALPLFVISLVAVVVTGSALTAVLLVDRGGHRAAGNARSARSAWWAAG